MAPEQRWCQGQLQVEGIPPQPCHEVAVHLGFKGANSSPEMDLCELHMVMVAVFLMEDCARAERELNGEIEEDYERDAEEEEIWREMHASEAEEAYFSAMQAQEEEAGDAWDEGERGEEGDRDEEEEIWREMHAGEEGFDDDEFNGDERGEEDDSDEEVGGAQNEGEAGGDEESAALGRDAVAEEESDTFHDEISARQEEFPGIDYSLIRALDDAEDEWEWHEAMERIEEARQELLQRGEATANDALVDETNNETEDDEDAWDIAVDESNAISRSALGQHLDDFSTELVGTNHCIICMDDCNCMRRLHNCGHRFCAICLERHIKSESKKRYHCMICRRWMFNSESDGEA